MRRLKHIAVALMILLNFSGCDPGVSKDEPTATIEIATSFRLGNGVSVHHFICRGDSPGHMRFLWGYPEFETYRPGVALTKNKETGLFEAGIMIITSPRIEGETLVSIGCGAPDNMGTGATQIVKSDGVAMEFHTPSMNGNYDRDLTIGKLGGYEFIVSLDSAFFDYHGSERVPRVSKPAPPTQP